jgi:ABC-type bacteriocin/lantibiotic exporter with double-glycine peptidase domain
MGTLDLCAKASAVSVAAYGSSLVRRGHLTAGQLTAFTLYSGLAGMGLAGLVRARVRTNRGHWDEGEQGALG